MDTERQKLGAAGEDAAACWLQQRGCQILARNARTRYGEIDLVVWDRGTLVFVEVKSRSGSGFGHPAEAIGPRKRLRLSALAEAFMRARGIRHCAVRFDAIAVLVDPLAGGETVEHIPNAFDAGA